MWKKILYILWYNRKTSPLSIIKKSYMRYQENGMKEVRSQLNREYYSLVPHASNNKKTKASYKKWIKKNEQNKFKVKVLSFNPLISIITPTYNTDKMYLTQMIESVLAQKYANWELCIADDASTSLETLAVLKKYELYDSRIKIIYREKNGHISEASNSAMSLAIGEYVVFLGHDDLLSKNALYSMVKRLNKKPYLKLIYSDEDKIDKDNNRYDPHFKSGWNPDMFFSQNYIAHLTLIKKYIVDQVGGFRVGYEGSQDYDLFLRCYQIIDDSEIGHIEQILYHWRAIQGSTALSANEKRYTTSAGVRALQDYFKHMNKKVTVGRGKLENTYKVKYHLEKEPPLVSIIIPTRDRYQLLSKCIDSIFEKTTYKNYEILILDNESSDVDILEYFEVLKQYKNIRIISYPYPFNFSAINNFGVSLAKGEVVTLLNNDIEVISRHWLTEMVQHALRLEIGAVGAMLYYRDNTIQHGGVVIGLGGVAGHSHKYFPKNASGYFSRLKVIQNYAAVTGACLVVRKSLYEEVGGLNEKNLTIAFNDVDFCLKLQEKGYRNLWTPYAELYHHESKSRGEEDTKEKQKRFGDEIKYMKNHWKTDSRQDKYYNRHLTRAFEDFRLGIEK
ncbi:MAG: glycosyltransferase family 2 protein [Campylobacterota bacterium]|nr:glycosyltransferase family 2 protein [Campylobacterota bacterium]